MEPGAGRASRWHALRALRVLIWYGARASHYFDKELSMNWNVWIRQIHRWVSIIFVVIVAGIFMTLGVGGKPPNWVYLAPLLPLALLAITGLYLFVLPYAAKRRKI
jgi:hypothetical protein